MDDLLLARRARRRPEVDVIRNQLARNHVSCPRRRRASSTRHGRGRRQTTARSAGSSGDAIVVAVGTTPSRPDGVDFDDRTILDSDGILKLDRIPSSIVVVGAGVIGIEYASMFAALGTRVTVVERRERLLEFCDAEIVEALQYHLRDLGVIFRFGESVAAVETTTAARSRRSRAASTSRPTRCSTPPAARAPPTGSASSAGLESDERGRIKVDDGYRTAVRTSSPSAT